MTRAAFTLLEVLLALIVVALVMASLGPALTGALRAQRQAGTVLAPLGAEQAAIAVLRQDLSGAARPAGTVTQPCTVVAGSVDGATTSTLQLTTDTPPPLAPSLALRPAELGQATVTWTVQTAADGNGVAWVRTRQPNLLATGTAPDPVPEVMLDHLSLITVEAWSAGGFVTAYDSSRAADALPSAVRVRYAYSQDDGTAGPLRSLVIDLPQVALDPLQLGTGSADP